MEMERFVWFGEKQTVTLSAWTTGGPPHGIWKRNDVVIESDDPDFTITFELDQSEEDFLIRVPYTSRLTSHGPTSGIFTYEVTNRLTPVLLFRSITIDGMCLGSDESIIIPYPSIIRCRCKSTRGCSTQCKCAKAGLSCTDLCRNLVTP